MVLRSTSRSPQGRGSGGVLLVQPEPRIPKRIRQTDVLGPGPIIIESVLHRRGRFHFGWTRRRMRPADCVLLAVGEVAPKGMSATSMSPLKNSRIPRAVFKQCF